ncbi:hypothetical protein [Arcicella aurantiaca]|nr:hypothetical protein [Arcicella aurantiaca]
MVRLFLLVFVISFFVEVGYKFIKHWSVDYNLLSEWIDSTLTFRKIGIWLSVTLGFALYQEYAKNKN